MYKKFFIMNDHCGQLSNKILYIEKQVESPIKKSNEKWYSCIEQETSKTYTLPQCYLEQNKKD